jgi:uncharacterized protein (TIGR02271 family)
MTIGTDINRIEGSTVYDSAGDKVGKVGQVYLDDQTQQPTWVTVSTGFFGTSETFVPIEGARFEGDDIHVGFDKAKIKDAPRVEVDQHLSETEEAELYRYYGLEWGSGYTTDTTTTGTTTDTTTGYADTTRTTDDASMTVSEERMVVDTESREAGRARLRKYTTTETETVSVPVTKEKLVVERNPVADERSAAPISDTDDVEEVTLREERAVVDKETVAVEEVRVGKEQVTEHEQVSAEVRKEHVDVDGDTTEDRDTYGR